MAHTSHGNLTGRAAATDRRDTIEYVNSVTRPKTLKELQHEHDSLCVACIELEGDDSFWAWWDDDNNVPPVGTYSQRIALLQQRIANIIQGVKQ